MATAVRWCAEEDLPAVRALIAEHLDPQHVFTRDDALLRWQFAGPDPVRDTPSILLAWDDDELVAMQGLIPVGLVHHGEVLSGAWMCNLLASPRGRERGAGLAVMLAATRQGFDGTWVMGLNDEVAKLLGAARFSVLPSVPRHLATTAPDRLAELLVLAGHATSEAHDAAQRLTAAVVPTAPGLAFEAVEAIPGDWDPWWRERSRTLAGTDRTAAHLTWRYLAHPRYAYRATLVRSGGAVAGLAVHRIEPVGGTDLSVLRIVEVVADPAVEADLHRHLLAVAEAEGVAFADVYDVRPDAGRGAAGFLPAPAAGVEVPSRFQPLAAGDRPLAAAFRWSPRRKDLRPPLEDPGLYVTKSDGDMDRPR